MTAIEPEAFELAEETIHEADDAPRRNWKAAVQLWLPLGTLILVVLLCFLGPVLLPIPAPVGGNVLESGLPAGSPGHLLGTDTNGNDILARLLHGGRASLIIGTAVQALGFLIGGTLGALSAYIGGVLDTIVMRLLDVLIAFPSLVLTLAVAQSLGPSMRNTVFALAFFSIPAFARIARAATLGLRELPFMAAAELSGAPRWRILLRHIAPNIGPQLASFTLLGMGVVIIIEGALSFLGMGVPPPAPSWGNIIYDGSQAMTATPALVLWPSLFLFVSVLAFNMLGETLRARWSQA